MLSACELAALGSTTTLDFYKRIVDVQASPGHGLRASKLFTVLWGLVAVSFATFASLLDNLIQAVNILGSIFYGTVLGLFVVAFFIRRVTATPVLLAAFVAQGRGGTSVPAARIVTLGQGRHSSSRDRSLC